MDRTTGQAGAAGTPSQGSMFQRHPEPLVLHGDVLDLTTQSSPASQPAAAEPPQVAPATTTAPVAAPAPAVATAPVQEEPAKSAKRPTAVKVFWWSAAIGLISFLLFGLCLETFDPDGESFLTTILAFGFFFGFVTAVCALVYLVVRRFTGK